MPQEVTTMENGVEITTQNGVVISVAPQAEPPHVQHTCEDCGAIMSDDATPVNTTHNDNIYLCSDCISDNYVECNDCGILVHSDDYSEANGNYYCDDCYCESFTSCQNCGDSRNNEDVHEGTDGNYYCESCAENMSKCHTCERLIVNDNRHINSVERVDENDDENVYRICRECYIREIAEQPDRLERFLQREERQNERRREQERLEIERMNRQQEERNRNRGKEVARYHSLHRGNLTTAKDKWRIGIEIEKEDIEVRYKEDTMELRDTTGWCKESDGSLDGRTGFELVSPILPLENVGMLKTVFDRIEDYINAKKSRKCGGHIHISHYRKAPSELLAEYFRGYLPLFYAMYRERAIVGSYSTPKKYIHYQDERCHTNAFSVLSDTLEIRIFPSPRNRTILEWRLELLRIITRHPRRRTSTVLHDIMNRQSELYRHMRKVYTREQIIEKCQHFIEYAKNIDEITTNAELAGTIARGLKKITDKKTIKEAKEV